MHIIQVREGVTSGPLVAAKWTICSLEMGVSEMRQLRVLIPFVYLVHVRIFLHCCKVKRIKLRSGSLYTRWDYVHVEFVHRTKKKTNVRGLSPQTNYTDRATAACRRSYCQLLLIEGATWSA
jgi:hypothetical protein